MSSLLAIFDGQDINGRIALAHLCYLASIILFVFGIQRMGKVKTARNGNHLAGLGMLLAVVGQFVEMGSINPVWIIIGLAAGGTVGIVMALKVKMTQMPEMVALLNGFGALASMVVAIAIYARALHGGHGSESDTLAEIMTFEGKSVGGIILMLTILVGASTFTGSLLAFCKLSEWVNAKWKCGRPIIIPGRHYINAALFLLTIILSFFAVCCVHGPLANTIVVIIISIASLILGWTLVLGIGGGDMPVVISLHNSYSGLAGALAGFVIGNPPLIVSGALVGSAGLILTLIMCKAMNRSVVNVAFGGATTTEEAAGKDEGYKNVKSTEPEEAAQIFADAKSCIIVPGYGLAVAQAQHACREFGDLLESRGCTVRYAVHPVAGRMPGHMNVLLAEANISYDKLFEMDQINEDFRNTDVALVIGANDVVNPAAMDNPKSPIYGMPILKVMEARTVFVLKRSLGAGFAGVKNELFEKDNTLMVFRDAKKGLEELGKAIKES